MIRSRVPFRCMQCDWGTSRLRRGGQFQISGSAEMWGAHMAQWQDSRSSNFEVRALCVVAALRGG